MTELRRTRRRVLVATIAGTSVLLAGCSDPDDTGDGDTGVTY